MSNRRREGLQEVACSGVVNILVAVAAAVVAVVSSAVNAGVAASVVSVVLALSALSLSVWRRHRGSRAPVDLRTVPPLTARSLRWVRGLLPGDEGAAWWAEVASLLAEAPDKSTRHRYVRSYRRKVPQLIWTSWTEHLRASRRRELS